MFQTEQNSLESVENLVAAESCFIPGGFGHWDLPVTRIEVKRTEDVGVAQRVDEMN